MRTIAAISGTFLAIIGIYRLNVRLFSLTKNSFIRRSRRPSAFELWLFDRRLSWPWILDVVAIAVGLSFFIYAANI